MMCSGDLKNKIKFLEGKVRQFGYDLEDSKSKLKKFGYELEAKKMTIEHVLMRLRDLKITIDDVDGYLGVITNKLDDKDAFKGEFLDDDKKWVANSVENVSIAAESARRIADNIIDFCS